MGLANKLREPRAPETGNDDVRAHLGVYVHVPFCAHACDFCAFYQVEPRRQDIDLYLETIEREFELATDEPRGCATAFWGGGTPGLLPARDLERLGRAQLARFGTPDREWTVELAPGSVRADKLAVLRGLGVTRASLGVQSLSPGTLEALGRRHSVAQVEAAWKLVKAAGFPSTNIDLIFGVPGQDVGAWRADLEAAAALEPDHLSTYCLTFEEDTALYVRLSAGKVSIDPEREAEFYEATWSLLPELGYAQYEISNHARPGHESLHNLNTWRMHAWQGFGPSAASQGGSWRGSNPPDLAAWRSDVERGVRAQCDRTTLTASQLCEDALIFGLRMNGGVRLDELEARFGAGAVGPFRGLIDSLVADGLATLAGGRVLALTQAGRLVVDGIGAELVGSAGSAG